MCCGRKPWEGGSAGTPVRDPPGHWHGSAAPGQASGSADAAGQDGCPRYPPPGYPRAPSFFVTHRVTVISSTHIHMSQRGVATILYSGTVCCHYVPPFILLNFPPFFSPSDLGQTRCPNIVKGGTEVARARHSTHPGTGLPAKDHAGLPHDPDRVDAALPGDAGAASDAPQVLTMNEAAGR